MEAGDDDVPFGRSRKAIWRRFSQAQREHVPLSATAARTCNVNIHILVSVPPAVVRCHLRPHMMYCTSMATKAIRTTYTRKLRLSKRRRGKLTLLL